MLHTIVSAISSYIGWVWNDNIILHKWCYSFDFTEDQTIGIGLGMAVIFWILQVLQNCSLDDDGDGETAGMIIFKLALGLNIVMYCCDFDYYSNVGSIGSFFAWFFILIISFILLIEIIMLTTWLFKLKIMHFILHLLLLVLLFTSASILARFAAYALPFFLIVGGLLSPSGRSHVGTFTDGAGKVWDVFK